MLIKQFTFLSMSASISCVNDEDDVQHLQD